MSREKKKGTSGNAKAFITREKSLKKLQLSLEEFRRLCILKGIYPRDPKKKLEGTDKTYYLRKDIDFLAHERLINTIREQNSHHKKVVKAQAKRRIDVLKRLALNVPKARLDHLIVERYPNFTDALRELDDPLCVVALFANLPADHKVGIAPKRVTNCQRLLREFHNFVAQTNALRRVFVSIKGYYFQAKISGEVITWVTPHRFSQILPADVDYSVMLTFLELYECILSFVNFRLYVGANMAYPPKISRKEDAKGLELGSVETEKIPEDQKRKLFKEDQTQIPTAEVSAEAVKEAENLALATVEENDSENENEGDENGAVKADEATENQDKQESNDVEDEAEGIFAGKSFVLGREVPYQELEFTIMASGATKVIREDDLPSDDDRLSSFTHWIVDRPKISGDRDMSLEYVQPQYVFDSINAATLLPTSLYAPGANLPPHLSPFVTDEDDGGYRPWFKDVIDRIKAGDTSVVGEAARVVYAEGLRKEKQKNAKPDVTNETSAGKNKNKIKNVKSKEPAAEDTIDDESMGETSESDEEDSNMESESDDDDKVAENDDEGEEEREHKEKEAALSKQSKEMAALMLTRKKMRQYRKHRGRQRAEEATKKKLTDKRKALENEREETVDKKSLKRRKKVQ